MYRGSKNPLIVIVRQDLERGIAMAQACHAAYGFGKDNGNVETNGFLYVLAASREQIVMHADRLSLELVPFHVFNEPDLNDSETALCCACNPSRFKNLIKY